MNKHRHRLVYNRARQMLMVVAETAASLGTIRGGRDAVTTFSEQGFQARPLILALTLSWSVLAWLPLAAQAQLFPDAAAPGNQRATLLSAGNGVPLANIQTPSAGGVSRNAWSQFDVQSQGAILNNSRSNVQTQLGGWVQGNPWLAGGSARVILNEVHSSNPSLLKGTVEIAGDRAQFIIANPAGITCDGCGFLNANRATLTTGTPVLNGGNLDGYLVQRGTITIEGAGLDARQADYTDLIARAIQVNAGIWTRQLNATTGANQVDAANIQATPTAGLGPAPAYALDVAQLGGMYANKITLIGTEAGLGVRNAGNIGASAGEVVLTADGRLENSGSISAAQGHAVLTAQFIDNRNGDIRADGHLTLTSPGAIDNSGGLIAAGNTLTLQDPDPVRKTLVIGNSGGTLIAGRSLVIDSDSLGGDGDLFSGGDLAITFTQDYRHSGRLQADGNASLETAGTLGNQGTLQAGGSLSLRAASIDNQADGSLIGQSLHLSATDSHTLTNRGLIDGQDTFIETITLNNLGTGRIYGDHVAIAATTLSNEAENGVAPVIAARVRLDIGAETISNREHALIFSGGDLAMGGSLDANHHASGLATSLSNASASIEALGDLDLNARQISNTNEHFSTRVQDLGGEAIVEYQGSGSPNRYLAGSPDVYVYNDESDHLHTPEGDYESWLAYDYTRATTETRVQSSDPAQILSGGAMRINADTLLNDKSRIIAGGVLTATLGSLDNSEVAGERTTSDNGSVTSYWRNHKKGRDDTGSSSAAYTPATSIQTISLTPTVYRQHTAPGGSGAQLPVFPDIQEIASLVDPSLVIRTGAPASSLPSNSLFGLAPNPTSRYLIETDPQFANYRTWLSSDTLLSALGLDPTATQKRLGDGYYEQKLIREQIAQLTGRRFLDGYGNDEAQYQALLDNGATYARQWNLTPGIALSAGQMAALTSDLVWLVEQTLTLADGQTTQALVPQLYVRVRDGDLQASGALIAGNSVNLDLSGDLGNSGTIAGRNVVALTADNLKNLGGRISGNDVALTARSDLAHIGGIIEGMNSLSASAGRDLHAASTTRTQSNAQGSRSNIDRLATLYGGSGGIQLLAGRDLDLNALQATSAGGATITAGNDLNLGSVSESQSNRIVWNDKNTRKDSTRSDIGSTVQAQGDIRLQAGNDLNGKAASVTSEQGALVAAAGNNINLTAGEANRSLDEAHQHSSKGFLSNKTTTTRDTLDATTAVASTFSGQTVDLQAGNNLTLQGSNAVSDLGTSLGAGSDIHIEAAGDTTLESHFKDEKKSGLLGSGGIGFTIGTRQQSTDSQSTHTRASASTVGSTQGDITIQAGETYFQSGSDVLAPQGDIGVTAQQIAITEARETWQNTTETRFKQSGLTIALSSPVISTIQTVSQMKDAAGQTRDPRMRALAAASAGLNLYNNAEQISGAADAIARGDPKGAASLSISLGSSRSQSTQTQASDTAHGSNVAAGGDIDLHARLASPPWAGGGDLLIQGSQIQAGGTVQLDADNRIDLLAAGNSQNQSSSQSGSSASLGVSVGAQTGVVLSAGRSSGQGQGEDRNWTQTRVEGNQATLASAGDTTLQGAVIAANQVTADIAGNLAIESLQDTSSYRARSRSGGFSLVLGPGGVPIGGNLSAGKSNLSSNYRSVVEQSGIKAGDGGFQVTVADDTDLKGGAITSTQTAIDQGRNRFATGGNLTLSDLQNQADYQGKAVGINLGSALSLDGKLAPSGTAAGIGRDDGSTSSTSQAAISGLAGNQAARTGDGETGISPIFDAERVSGEINAQVAITQAFGREAPKAVASYAAGKATELRNVGNATEAKKWEEGGAYRIALHSAVGALIGGLEGAAGAVAAASSAPLLEQLQAQVLTSLENAGLSPDAAKLASQTLAQATAAGLGAAVGGTYGAVMAFNVDTNNRQLHPKEVQWLKDKAKRFAKQQGISEDEALARLTQQALRDVDYFWRAQLADGDDATAKTFLGTAKQTFTNGLGERQLLFTAPGQQLFRPEMFADSADPAFYQQFAQSGISRSLSAGLAKEFKDSGIALKDGTIDLAKAARDNPGAVLNGLWNGVKGLPQAVKDSFKETGHALGEGSAVALNDDLGAKLNAIYGSDVSGYQEALLAIRTLSAISGAAGVAKVGGGLSEGAARAVGKKLDEVLIQNLALKGVQVGAIHGFKSADELNGLMGVYKYAPGWKAGTQVAETTLQPGTRVRMVVDERAFRSIEKGETGRAFGSWATFDNVPSQAYARNQLAITPEFKQNVGYVVEVEITRPIQAQIGVVGSQGGTAGGGGNQLNFLMPRDDRSAVFKYVQGSGRVLP